MARARHTRKPRGGPAEGRYDPRKGAQSYAPIVASFGALAVTAIAVVFTIPRQNIGTENLVLTTGLLAMAVLASFLGSFGLAAVGAEVDPTANIPASVMYIAVPVALALLGILGAFAVLANTFVPEATTMFVLIAAAGGAGAAFFSAAVVGDSWGMQPMTMSIAEYDEWRASQWIKDGEDADLKANVISIAAAMLMFIAVILRIAGAQIDINLDGARWTVGVGIILTLAGTALALIRAKHPNTGRNQVGIKAWEAWACTMTIGAYAFWLVLVLPTGA